MGTRLLPAPRPVELVRIRRPCPDPLDASALLRRPARAVGRRVLLRHGPRLELVVDRPSLDPRGAAQAAAELHAYCIDTEMV